MDNAIEITLDCTFGKMAGIYSGETKNGIPHGRKVNLFLKIKIKSGWYYEGDFVEGHFEGTGKQFFKMVKYNKALM